MVVGGGWDGEESGAERRIDQAREQARQRREEEVRRVQDAWNNPKAFAQQALGKYRAGLVSSVQGGHQSYAAAVQAAAGATQPLQQCTELAAHVAGVSAPPAAVWGQAGEGQL